MMTTYICISTQTIIIDDAVSCISGRYSGRFESVYVSASCPLSEAIMYSHYINRLVHQKVFFVQQYQILLFGVFLIVANSNVCRLLHYNNA